MIIKVHLNVPVTEYLKIKQLYADWDVFKARPDPDGPRGGFSKAEEKKAIRLGDMQRFKRLEDTNKYQRFTVGGVEYQRVVLKTDATGRNNFQNWFVKIQEDWPGTTMARAKDMAAGLQAGLRMVKHKSTFERKRTQNTNTNGVTRIKTRERPELITVAAGRLWEPGQHFAKALPRRNQDVQKTDDDGNVTIVNELVVSEFGLESGEPPDYDLDDAPTQLAAEPTT